MQAKLVQLHHYQEELRMEDIVPSRHKVLCTVPKTHYSSQTDQVDSLLYNIQCIHADLIEAKTLKIRTLKYK